MPTRISRCQGFLVVLLLLLNVHQSSGFSQPGRTLRPRILFESQPVVATRSCRPERMNSSTNRPPVALAKPIGASGDVTKKQISAKQGYGGGAPLGMFLLSTLAHGRWRQGTASSPESDVSPLSRFSLSRLQRDGVFKWMSVSQFLTLSVLLWQVGINAGPLMRWTSAAGTAFVSWYVTCLSAYPIRTKSITTGVIGWIGDTMAQLIETKLLSAREGTKLQFRQTYDRRRGISCLVDGILVMGPLLHFAYEFLEWLIPVSGAVTGLAAAIAALTQVFIDDFIFDTIFVGIMFFVTGIGEGISLSTLYKQFRKDYARTVRTSWATSVVLMPIEFMLFRFFPLRVRVLGMNVIDIIWEGMVSYLVHRRRHNGADAHHEPMPLSPEPGQSPPSIPLA